MTTELSLVNQDQVQQNIAQQHEGDHDKQMNDKFNDLIKQIEKQRKLSENQHKSNGL